MPANKNALIRYKTIDACLRNRYRRWTLNDLIDACSDALYDCEGRQENLSRRTIQKDLAIMRSNKLGYNAPIEVYDGKYYRYSDPDYSIMNMPISDKDYRLLNEVVGLLSQFEDFEFFQQISDMVSRLQDMLSITHDNRKPVVMMDTNRLLRGLKWLNPIYHCIENHIAIRIIYRKYHAKKDRETVFFSVLLKEYNNVSVSAFTYCYKKKLSKGGGLLSFVSLLWKVANGLAIGFYNSPMVHWVAIGQSCQGCR